MQYLLIDGQKAIWVLPFWGEMIWIWIWSLAGGLLGRKSQYYLRHFGVRMAAICVSVYIICLLAFHFQGWLPLVPPILALLMTGTGVWWFTLRLHIARPLVTDNNHTLLPQ